MNDLKLAFFLAIKSIARGNKGSFIMVIMIMMIVFVNLLFTDAIFAGISKGMSDNKVDYQYGEITIEPKVNEKFILSSDVREIIDKYKDIEKVSKISPILKTGALYVNEKEGDGRDEARISGTLLGVSLEEKQNVFDIKSNLLEGRFLKKDDVGKIVIGMGLSGGYKSSMFSSDLEGVKVGEKISVEFNGLRKSYEIIGIFQTKSSSTDRMGVVIRDDLKTALDLSGEASEIILRLNSRDDSEKIMREFQKSQFSNYEISDWKIGIAKASSIDKSFSIIGSILRVIGALVAGLVIFIIVFVDIVNKRRQVGILKAIGIKQEIVINSYIIRGMVYAGLGIVLGYLLMVFVIIAFFTAKPIDLPMADVIPVLKDSSLSSSIMFFLVAGFIGSLIPARQEIKKKILDLLYH